MDLIVETDCGHDPDDFFTLCYLAAAGVFIRCITVTPGDRDQLAVLRLFCEQVGLDIPIGHSKASDKYSSGSVHHTLLEKYGKPRQGNSDGRSKDLLRASKLFREAMRLLLDRCSTPGCRGKVQKIEPGWGTVPTPRAISSWRTSISTPSGGGNR